MELRGGYKRTEVGVIPADWGVERLDSLGSGAVPAIKAGPFGSSLTKNTYVSTGYKVYGQEQVIRDDYLYGDYFISSSKYKELEACAVKPGDVLLSLVGTAGKLLVVPEGAPPGVINPRLLRLSFDRKRVDPLFFKNLFQSNPVQSLLARSAQGGTMGVLNAGMLRPMCMPLPQLPEQRAIARALSDVDALLAKIDQLIAKKRDIKQATMQQLLSGQTRLPGFSGAWEVKRLGELLSYEQPTPYLVKSAEYADGNSVPVLTAGKTFILGYTNEMDGVYSSPPVIIFDDFTTASKFVDFPFKAKSSAMKILKARERHAHIRFAFERMQIIDFQLGDHKRYWISEYSKLPIECPSLVEQTAIATVLSDMDAELASLEARRDKTRALKQGMMQALLSGKIRL